MKIYFSPYSPYVRKCLVTAHELGLNGRIELLPSNAHPVQRDAHLIDRNPLGKVPTLITDDGTALYDSRVICEYLDELAGGTLFPRSSPARWQALTLQSLADGMLDAALLARYEDVARPEALRWPEWRAAQLDKLGTSLAALEAATSTLTNHADIGTLSLGCVLWYADLRFPELNWRPRHPRVAAWAEAFGQRPSMQAVWSI
ncbi:MAG: glutathione S-transferase [Bacteriovorax sp.]|nr:glutathione S-transferase [Rhizobacter sp.]